MAAYVVGIIAGALVTVFPLIYLMSFDRSLALILQVQPDFDVTRFEPSHSLSLASSVTAIGAVVLLLSTALMALTTLRRMRRAQAADKPARSQEPDLQEEMPEL
jgi:hypothetical protein